MNSVERKIFWDTLCKLHDNNPEHVQKLLATIKRPHYLCRFRAVSESSLKQLQENKLKYSSADHYDDPFDTFIHVDLARIKEWYDFLSKDIQSENPLFINIVKQWEPVLGISAEQFLSKLKDNPFDISSFPDRIKQIRTIIQKNLFSICFCGDELNETLWLKYANNYKGFALVYDIGDENTFLCGKETICKNCCSVNEKPFIYPVYYTEDVYNATSFALACLLWNERNILPPQIIDLSYKAVMWEAERISLIKKKCHEHDDEWRMIRPTMSQNRSCIKMKPYKVIVGLRMPEYERLLVSSAAKIAGIGIVEELYIDDSDNLSTRQLTLV